MASDSKAMAKIGGSNWLNRNILGLGITRFFSDFSHEMATAVLPTFLVSIGGSAATLGLIEGSADAFVSLMKLLSGWYSDYLGKRKPFMVLGHFLTTAGIGALFLSLSWAWVFGCRVIAWMGRGIRTPVHDATLSDSAESKYYGRVFGFDRMMDTSGAVLGPAAAFFLIKFMPERPIFLITLIPGILCVLSITLLVKEVKGAGGQRKKLFGSFKSFPRQFRLFLISALIFGLGNFADSLFILRATELLTPANGAVAATSLAILFYTIHNIIYAVGSYPLGALADKIGKKTVLVFGYFLTGVVSVIFIANTDNVLYLGSCFAIAGLAIAITDALQGTVIATIMPSSIRATGYGTLALVNSIGNFTSSALVGFLWTTVSPLVGFGFSAVLLFIGTLLFIFIRGNVEEQAK
jgi:MFS family permease